MRFRLGGRQRTSHKNTAPYLQDGVVPAEGPPVIRVDSRGKNQLAAEPRQRRRPIRKAFRWIAGVASAAIAGLGRWLAGIGESAQVRQAKRQAAAAKQEFEANHKQWQAHKRDLVADHESTFEAALSERDSTIRRLQSELSLVKLERAALLEVVERDRERVRAETAIESSRIAAITVADGNAVVKQP